MATKSIDERLIPSVQYVTPTTGTTVNMTDHGNLTLFINPAGTILALTLALNSTPVDGDKITLSSSQIVTGFTISGGTVIGALTALAVATFEQYTYSSSASKWFRTG